ncbi:MAG TPA: HAMP domain-containing sensor histidine kinase [Terriglobales bacterium]|nr:HAMP domain-containing sensor histidine kinase [Terriglobales bacterium]
MSILRSKNVNIWLLAILVVYALVALVAPRGYGLATFGNLGQALLQAVAVAAFLLNAKLAGKHRRAFWVCLAMGGALWFAGQCMWVYYEVILKLPVPNPFSADILFFLHTVPLIAATTLQPHAELTGDDHHFRLGYFDFAMLLVWWVFIYGYIVGPWQYVELDERTFGSRYNFLYLAENLFVIAAFGVLWLRTNRSWRRVYGRLFLTYAVYASSSYVLNVAIDNHVYYTGSIYDIPLVAAILLQAYTALFALRTPLEQEPALISVASQNSWHGRLAAAAVISMPLFAFWDALAESTPDSIQHFRLLLTLACMLLLMLLLFFKQSLLEGKLISLLQESRNSYDDLQRIQGQLVQTEKLASIGRLVAGAAHEINNPLTAILGYSDLLIEDNQLAAEQLDMAQKIRQQARRTKQLVQNFLTFATQAPMRMRPLDFNLVVANGLQLQELDSGHKDVKSVRRLPDSPVVVNGDENHLLQMCVHIFNNAAEAMVGAHGRGVLTVSLEVNETHAVLKCRDTGPGVAEPGRIFDPFYTTKAVGKGTGLGLSACYGIVRDHGGLIGCTNLPGGGALFEVTLPLATGQPLSSIAVAHSGAR